MRALFLAAVLFGGACAGHREDTPPKAPPPSASTAPDSALSPEVKQALCASELAGGMAKINLLRDASGALKLLVLRPDIGLAEHAPWTYYDPSGALLLTVPERPMTKEEREADPIIQQLEALKKDLTEDNAGVFCR